VIVALWLVVGLGFAGLVALGVANGLDPIGALIAALVAALGALAIAAAHKMHAGTVEPGRCETCGGLVARSAPYCKHCGARRSEL
jgi:hypothetical protein